MADIQAYAQWLVANQDKRGTKEFDTVSSAYKALRAAPDVAPAATKKPEDTSGFVPAAKAGLERLKGEAALVAGKTGLMSLPAAEAYKKEREAEAARVFTPTQEGWTEAPWTKFKETLGGSLPYMAAPLAAGAAAAALPLTGTAATVAGLGAAGLASGAQFTGSNIARQMETGKTLEEASLGKAALAAVPQAALDTLSMRMLPGIGKIFGAAGAPIAAETAEQVAKQSLAKIAADYAKATGKAMTTEGLTEAGQQVLERMQAGLQINDPEARKEYFESFLGGAILGGTLAPAGRYIERGSEQRAREEAATKAERERMVAADKARKEQEAKDKVAAEATAAQETAAYEAALEAIPTMSYEDMVTARERWKQKPKSTQKTGILKALDAQIKKSNVSFAEQQAKDRAMSAESAFAQPDAQVMSREEVLRQQAGAETKPTGPLPEGALTEEDIAGLGAGQSKLVNNWLRKNVLGKSPDDLRALLDDENVTGVRRKLVEEALTPQGTPYQEPATEPVTEETAPAAEFELPPMETMEERMAAVAEMQRLRDEAAGKLAAAGKPPRANAGAKKLAAWESGGKQQYEALQAEAVELNRRASLISEALTPSKEETDVEVPAEESATPGAEGGLPPTGAAGESVEAAGVVEEEAPAAAPDLTEAQSAWDYEWDEGYPTWDELSPKLQREWAEGSQSGAEQERIVAEHRGEPYTAEADEASDAVQAHIADGDLARALMEVANTSEGLEKALATRLEQVLRRADVELSVGDAEFNGKKVAGVTGRDGDWITLDPEHGAKSKKVLLHEALHAATVKAMRDPANAEIVGEIKRIQGIAQKALKGKGFDEAFTSPEEFVAHALTDRSLQTRLSEIAYTPEKSLWDKLKTTLLEMVTGKKIPDNLLDAVLATSDSIFKAPVVGEKPSKPGFAAQMNPALEQRAAGLEYKEKSPREAIASAVTTAKDNYDKRGELVTKIRTQVVDKFATVERRLAEKVDGVRKTGSLRSAAIVIARQAEDIAKLLPDFFRRGGLVVDPTTGKLIVTDKANNPEQMFGVIKTLATKYGKSFEQTFAYASTVMEGRRLQSLIEKNKNLTEGEREVLIHWRKPDGKVDYASIKQAAMEYDAHDEYKALAEIMDEPRKGVMNELIKSGWVDQKTGETLRDVEYYVPFDRISPEGVEKMFREIKKTGARGLASASKMPELKGAFDMPVGNVFESYFKTMSWLVTELAKQNANTHMITDMADLGYATRLGQSKQRAKTDYTVALREKGETVYYELPSKYDMVAFLDKSAPKRWYVTALSQLAGFTRGMITANPVFAMRQVAMDIQGALLLADVRNPATFARDALGNFASLSWHEAKNIWKNIKGEPTERHAIEKFMESRGLAGEIDYITRDPALDILFEQGIRKRTALGSPALGAIIHGLKQITHASDLAVRAALHKDSMRARNDMMLADTKARELINFRRRGANTLIQDFTAMVPFLNAHLQSMDVLLREATGVGPSITGLQRKEAKAKFIKMMGLYAGLATAYALARHGDEDYDNMDERTKNGNWLFPGEGGGIRIPIRSDIGLVKVAIENAVDYKMREGTMEERRATQAVAAVLTYGWEAYGGSIVPLPPGIRQMFENLTNHSFLTGRQLVGNYQRTLLPHMQQTSATSETAKSMAKFLSENVGVEMSPILLDNALRGIFGTVGATVAGMTDSMLNPDATDRPVHKLIGVGAFAWDKAQLTGPKDELYDLMNDVMPLRATFNELKRADPERAQEFYTKHAMEIGVANSLPGVQQSMGKIREALKYYDSPMAKERLTVEERTQLKQQANEQYNMLAGFVRELRARTGV